MTNRRYDPPVFWLIGLAISVFGFFYTATPPHDPFLRILHDFFLAAGILLLAAILVHAILTLTLVRKTTSR